MLKAWFRVRGTKWKDRIRKIARTEGHKWNPGDDDSEWLDGFDVGVEHAIDAIRKIVSVEVAP